MHENFHQHCLGCFTRNTRCKSLLQRKTISHSVCTEIRDSQPRRNPVGLFRGLLELCQILIIQFCGSTWFSTISISCLGSFSPHYLSSFITIISMKLPLEERVWLWEPAWAVTGTMQMGSRKYYILLGKLFATSGTSHSKQSMKIRLEKRAWELSPCLGCSCYWNWEHN